MIYLEEIRLEEIGNIVLTNLDRFLLRLIFCLGMSNTNKRRLLSLEEITSLIAIRWYAGYGNLNIQVISNKSDFYLYPLSFGGNNPYCFRVARRNWEPAIYETIENRIRSFLPGIAVVSCEQCGSRLGLTNNKTCDVCLPHKVNSDGFVYLYGNMEKGLFKIGASKNPKQRVMQLNKISPYLSVLLHKIPAMNMREAERLLHIKYADKKQLGEWFELNMDDVSDILATKCL